MRTQAETISMLDADYQGISKMTYSNNAAIVQFASGLAFVVREDGSYFRLFVERF